MIDDETEADGSKPGRADSAIERASLMWSRIAKLKQEEERIASQLIREVDSYAEEAETEFGQMTSKGGSGSGGNRGADSDGGTFHRKTLGTIQGEVDGERSASAAIDTGLADDKLDQGHADDLENEYEKDQENFTRTFIDQADFSYFTTLKHQEAVELRYRAGDKSKGTAKQRRVRELTL